MAKDFLLPTLGTIASATQITTSGTKLYSPPLLLEPFGSNGINSLLYMRWMLSPGVTYAAVPAATTTSAFQFGCDVSKDGSTWTSVHQGPTETQAFRTHDVYTIAVAASQSNVVINYATVSTTAAVSASANITGAPVVSVGDVVYFGTTANGFTAATPYYVILSTPTNASTGSSTSTCTIQVSLTPGGPAVVGTGAGTPTVTKYLSNSVNIAVGDQMVLTGANLTGTPGNIVSGDTVNVISVTSSYTGLTITINKVGVALFVKDVTALTAGTVFLTRALNPSGEYYTPLPLINGFIDGYGQVQDAYKYVRGWATCTFPSGVNPTLSCRCDIVSGRDGAYS